MSPATMAVIWLLIAAVLFVVEGITVELVSIWFGFGALVAMMAASLGAPVWVQLLLFLLSSILVLFLGRPILMKHLKVTKRPTNADMAVGQVGLVLSPIDNVAQTGRVSVMGLDWSARSAHGDPIPEGARVLVLQIDGVKLIVEPVPDPVIEPTLPPEPESESTETEDL